MKKEFSLVVVAFIVVCSLSGCAKSNKHTDDEYEELNNSYISILEQMPEKEAKIAAAETELSNAKAETAKITAERDNLKSDYESLQKNFQEWNMLSDSEKQAKIDIAKHTDEISKLDETLASKQNEVDKLEQDIEKLKSDISKYEGELIKAKGSPLTFPAGYFTAGNDFETGRYKIYGGSSNFVVHNSSGKLKVNIILGSNVSEYVYKFSSGDEIEARSSFKMVPVE